MNGEIFKIDDIELLKNICKVSNSLIEIRKALFRISQLDVEDAKNVTGITQKAFDKFSREDIIKIAQNVDTKDRIELVKFMKLSNMEFKDILVIFDKTDLLQATKEFGVTVTADDLRTLFNNSQSKNDKDFIQFLINMNPAEAKTITEIVIENFKSNDLISIVRNNNLVLNPEQLQSILIQKDGLSKENLSFIEEISSLSSRNSELSNTINYKILGEKFKGLEKYLPIITCHPQIQQSIIDLKDSEYQAFLQCLDFYSKLTPDWTNIADGLLKNISQYEELIANLDESVFSTPAKMELLTKVLSEPNYFQISTLNEYLRKKDQVCNEILSDSNGKRISAMPYLQNLSEIDRTRFAILEQNYGISLEQASSLVAKFSADIDTLEQDTPETAYYRSLIENLNFICTSQSIEELTSHIYSTSNKAINSNLIERQIKDTYDKEFVDKLYRPTEDDLLPQEDLGKYLGEESSGGIQFYLAGKSTNGEFFMESHAPGAVYSDDLLKEKTPQYAESWNKPLMQSQAFCTHLTSNQMLFSNIRDVEYGFYDYEQGSLRAAGYEDISSDFTHFTGFADHDEKYSSLQQRIDKTRGNDESDRARNLPNGTKRQPDYIRLLTSRHIPQELASQKLEHSKLAAKQFTDKTGKQIPIVIVDQDECTIQENKIIRDMITEFKQTRNPELISKIVTRFENNRAGNKWNGIDFAIDVNSKADEMGKTIITRNEMLTSLINVIEQCPNRTQAENLYQLLSSTIIAEASKFKSYGYKTMNDDGIPIVQKGRLNVDNYFTIGRDKQSKEPIRISAYDRFKELHNKLKESKMYMQETDISKATQLYGKKTVNENIEVRDSIKSQMQRDVRDFILGKENQTNSTDDSSVGGNNR